MKHKIRIQNRDIWAKRCLPGQLDRSRYGHLFQEAGAYLTIFLSLTLTVMLSLIFTLIYGTRVNAVKMQTEIILDTAANSCLGEYSRELLSQYDLFFIDTSYGTSAHSEEKTRQHLQKYAEGNIQGTRASLLSLSGFSSLSLEGVSVSDGRFACDRNYTPILEQITAYMTADPAGSAAEELISLVDNYESIGLDLNEWGRQKSAAEEELESAREARQTRIDERSAEDDGAEEVSDLDGSGGQTDSQANEDPEIEDPSALVDAFRQLSLQGQVFGADVSTVSGKSVSLDGLYSRRSPHYGSGMEAENSHHYQKASMAVLNLYLFEKCGNFRHQKDGSALDYELEYLLCGRNNDKDNLEEVLKRLCAIRTAANCMYLFSSSARRQEAEAVAGTIAAVTVTPALLEVYTTIILLAWGYVESISDLKTLTAGGKVPLLKDDGSWKCGIASIDHPSQVPYEDESHTDGNGLDYQQYLGILIFLQNRGTKMTRLMDICEMDIRGTTGNQNFCMDWCMDTFTASIMVSSSIGYSCSITRTITYN